MRGMAYDATLYSYKVDDGRGISGLEGLSSDSVIATIFNQHVTDNINVSNNSWGGTTAITAVSEATLRLAYGSIITAMRAAQNNGTIIVFASVNDTRSEADSWGRFYRYPKSEIESDRIDIRIDRDAQEDY